MRIFFKVTQMYWAQVRPKMRVVKGPVDIDHNPINPSEIPSDLKDRFVFVKVICLRHKRNLIYFTSSAGKASNTGGGNSRRAAGSAAFSCKNFSGIGKRKPADINKRPAWGIST